MKYINKKMVVAINRICTEITGGAVVSATNIRSGVALNFVDGIYYNRVFGQQLYPDIFHQAAAYMFHIVKNHVFTDGNKRTGLCCALTFLEWNGYTIKPLHEDKVFDFVVQIAGGPNQLEQIPVIAAWLQTEIVSDV